MTDLGALGPNDSVAIDINATGQIVGLRGRVGRRYKRGRFL